MAQNPMQSKIYKHIKFSQKNNLKMEKHSALRKNIPQIPLLSGKTFFLKVEFDVNFIKYSNKGS